MSTLLWEQIYEKKLRNDLCEVEYCEAGFLRLAFGEKQV